MRLSAPSDSHISVLSVANLGPTDLVRGGYLYIITGMSDLTPRQSQVLHLIRQALRETRHAAHARGDRRRSWVSAPPTPPRNTCARWRARAASNCCPAPRAASASRTPCASSWACRSSAAWRPAARSWPKSTSSITWTSIPAVFKPRPHYLLKVVGMSMKDAGILDGDLVAVHRTAEVRNRQIVVARLENEVTVKRYRQQGSIAWLLPENRGLRADPGRPAEAAAADRGRGRRGAAPERLNQRAALALPAWARSPSSIS